MLVAGVVFAAAAVLPLVAAEECTSAVWEVTSGDWNDADNWVDGVSPSDLEVAVIHNDVAPASVNITSDTEAFSIIISGSEPTVIDIGGDVPVWLILGEEDDEDLAPCSDSTDCAQGSLTLADGFRAVPLGSGIQYDAGSDEIIGTDLYSVFNVTCAAGYESVGNATSELVTCPFESSYDASSFDLLRCSEIIYESDWCSAGIWAGEGDGEWTNSGAWVYDTIPTEYDLAVLANPGFSSDAMTVTISDDVSVGALTIDQGEGSLVLEIGSDGAAMLVLAEEDALCSDGMCNDDQLLDNLPNRGYNAFSLGSGIALDLNTGDLTNTSRAFNVSCADGFIPAGDVSSTVVTCDYRKAFLDFDANASLQCVPEPGDWCSAAIWADTVDGSWGNGNMWVGSNAPSTSDLAYLSGDSEFVVSLNGDGAALALTIGDGGGSIVLEIGGDNASTLVLSDEEGELCGNYICYVEDLVVPSNYQVEPLGTGVNFDITTSE